MSIERRVRRIVLPVVLCFLCGPVGVGPAWSQKGISRTTTSAAQKDDDGDEGGATPDGDSRAPSGTGHGKAKVGEEGLLGDVAGLRPLFERYGVTFDLSETSEVLANPTGGLRQGGIYEGLLALILAIDLEKAAGLKGTSLNVSAFQIHGGPGLSASEIGNFNVVSDLENKRDSGLYEAWIQQAFATFDIRVGRMSVDEEFLLADSADVFMNGSFGWPTLTLKNLPNGGPIPADAAVRAHARFDAAWEGLAGLYRGSQSDTQGAGGAASTSTVSANGGLLAIAELQHRTGLGEGELPGAYKLGGWYRDGAVAQRPAGRSGAELFASLPDLVKRTYSFYAVADQRLSRGSGDEDSGFSAFLRVMAAPVGKSVVSAFVDGGLVYAGPFGRADDGVGIGFAVAQTTATSLGTLGLAAVRLGKAETSFEATYQAQLVKGVQLQTDIQYVIDPAGGRLTRSGRLLGDALVLGLRTTITF